MLTLSALKPRRIAADIPRPVLARLTLIDLVTLRDIELRSTEPWFDQALQIARTMNCSIHDLIAAEDLIAFDYDPAFHQSDMELWAGGLRLPLSVALRLHHRFGLPAVDDLAATPLMQQIWDTVSTCERLPTASGSCPWCCAHTAGGEPHSTWCLPTNLLALRRRTEHITLSDGAVAPLPGRKGRRAASARVHGLRALREALGLTQTAMAHDLGINPNHLARMERAELPMTLAMADTICERYTTTRAVLLGHTQQEWR